LNHNLQKQFEKERNQFQSLFNNLKKKEIQKSKMIYSLKKQMKEKSSLSGRMSDSGF
jgi:DNA-binding protein H-NS